MRIFGISLVTILVVAAAYWAGTRNLVGNVVAAARG